jgi:hypothetical protein
MKNKGVCFGRSAGSGVRNPSTSPMKRGASRVRSVAAARAGSAPEAIWLKAAGWNARP